MSVQNVVTYDVIIAVDNADLRLKPGMTANVRIVTAERPDVLRVPGRALRFRPPGATAPPPPADRGQAWRLDAGGSPQPVLIRTGIADEEHVEVLDGLTDGDQVVTGIERATAAAAPTRGPFGIGGGRH